MSQINTLEELQTHNLQAADQLTSSAGVIASRLEAEQRKLPESERMTGPEKKAIVVSELEKNIMALGFAVNVATGNNPLIAAGINLTGPLLEEIAQAGYNGVCWLWKQIDGWFDQSKAAQ